MKINELLEQRKVIEKQLLAINTKIMSLALDDLIAKRNLAYGKLCIVGNEKYLLCTKEEMMSNNRKGDVYPYLYARKIKKDGKPSVRVTILWYSSLAKPVEEE